MKISKNYLQKPQRDPHLHSPAHVLADELSSKLGDPKHFGFYLKTALTVDHNVLHQILGNVLEKSNRSPGALFAYLVKKYNREKNVSHGYSLWLLPEEDLRNQLKKKIQSFAETYNAPFTDPHITLLSGISGSPQIELLEQLTTLRPISAQVSALKTDDQFFKSFYQPVEKNKEISKTRKIIKKTFFPDAKDKFNPHISILYGNYKPEQKQDMLKKMEMQLPNEMVFDEIAIVNTNGTANEFKIIKSVKLQPEL